MQVQSLGPKSFGSGPSRDSGRITNGLAAEVNLPFCSVLLNMRTRSKTHLLPFLLVQRMDFLSTTCAFFTCPFDDFVYETYYKPLERVTHNKERFH